MCSAPACTLRFTPFQRKHHCRYVWGLPCSFWLVSGIDAGPCLDLDYAAMCFVLSTLPAQHLCGPALRPTRPATSNPTLVSWSRPGVLPARPPHRRRHNLRNPSTVPPYLLRVELSLSRPAAVMRATLGLHPPVAPRQEELYPRRSREWPLIWSLRRANYRILPRETTHNSI